jgi:hypothetical protein
LLKRYKGDDKGSNCKKCLQNRSYPEAKVSVAVPTYFGVRGDLSLAEIADNALLLLCRYHIDPFVGFPFTQNAYTSLSRRTHTPAVKRPMLLIPWISKGYTPS